MNFENPHNTFESESEEERLTRERSVSNPKIAEELSRDPKFARELQSLKDPSMLEDNKVVDKLIHNYELRKAAIEQSEVDFGNRLSENLYASDEELRAGVYKELLEPQVREAVFALRQKGYDTFESGFEDLVAGNQYIGFAKNSEQPISIDIKTLNEQLKEKGVVANFSESDDRYMLSIEADKNLSLDEWKSVWVKVAEVLPARAGDVKATAGAEQFAEKQRKLKNGEDVYLGGGWLFKGGKIEKAE